MAARMKCLWGAGLLILAACSGDDGEDGATCCSCACALQTTARTCSATTRIEGINRTLDCAAECGSACQQAQCPRVTRAAVCDPSAASSGEPPAPRTGTVSAPPISQGKAPGEACAVDDECDGELCAEYPDGQLRCATHCRGSGACYGDPCDWIEHEGREIGVCFDRD